jgi:hypothetical protein
MQAFSRTRWHCGDRAATDTNPTHFSCRHTQYQAVRRDIFGNHCASPNGRECPNPHAGTNDGCRSDAGTAFDMRPSQPMGFLGIAMRHRYCSSHAGAARKAIVDKDCAGTNEHIIPDRDPIPDHHAVFNGDTISDLCAGLNKCMIADVAIVANMGPPHHVSESPYAGSSTDAVAFAQCHAMDENFGIGHLI